MRLIGLDPGLRHTGWGVIESVGNRLIPVAAGAVHSDAKAPLAERLVALFDALGEVLLRYAPIEAAVEETFVNKNASSTLKLGHARGIALLAPAKHGIPVTEYSANAVKKAVVGVGHADKTQIQMMVRRLLPGCGLPTPDAADALAVAICHAHHRTTNAAWNISLSPAGRGRGPRVAREGEGAASAAATLPGAAAPGPSPRPSPRGGEGGAPLLEEAKRYPTRAETARARRLRQDQTNVEKLLWYKLRDRQIDGVKFRRQEPILGFTVDFVCHEQNLVIELDGGQHASFTVADERRTRVLSQAGFRVLRFWNNEVAENLDGVLQSIAAALAAPLR